MSNWGLEPLVNFDESIRFVYLIDGDGTLLDSLAKRGLASLEPDEVTRQIALKGSIGGGMLKSVDKWFGKTDSVVVNRERIRIMIFPVGDKMILVSTELAFPMEKLERLEELVASFGQSERLGRHHAGGGRREGVSSSAN